MLLWQEFCAIIFCGSDQKMKKQVKIVLCAAAAILAVITAVSVVKLVKSAQIGEEETTQPVEIDFEFMHKDEIELTLGKKMFSWVKSTDETHKLGDGDFVFFSTDESVVEIEFDHVEYDEFVFYKLTPVGVGTAQIYVQTADGFSVSEKITVTVTQGEENTVTVYRSETGDKYHSKPGCSSDKVYEISLADAEKAGLTPCKKCVQDK